LDPGNTGVTMPVHSLVGREKTLSLFYEDIRDHLHGAMPCGNSQ